ncbi:MAG: hypothetical protein KBS63_01330 [Clostridiales bacterium]|nr:hypothetical protein [Candidatus Crickella caballi]
MRMILENEFTWDGTYAIVDDHGNERYTIEAEMSEDVRRVKLYACTLDELNAHYEIIDSEPVTDEEKFAVASARIDKKYAYIARAWENRRMSKSRYTIEIGGKIIGTMDRSYLAEDDVYDIELKGMMVSGNVYDWNFIIVNKKEEMAHSIVSGNRLSLEYANDEYEETLAILLAILSGLAYDLRVTSLQIASGKRLSEREPISVPKFMRGSAQGSGLEEAIGMIRDGVEAAGNFGRKAVKSGNKAVMKGKKAVKIGKKGLAAGEKIIEKIFLTEEDRNRQTQNE